MKKLKFGAAALGMMLTANSAYGAETINAPLSTPPGITLIDVIGQADIFLWRSLGGSDGQLLYTYDADGSSGKSTCVAACAQEFPPYLAAASAQATGDWSVIRRDDGTRQWAYRGKPLHTSAAPLVAPASGPGAGPNADAPKDNTALMDPASKLYAPKEGWRRAAFDTHIAAPPDIALRSMPTANGYGFVVPRSGMTMYVFPTSPRDIALWAPVYAPTLASNVGDFSIIMREDGKRQWAYKGRALFTFKKDYTPGDTEGLLAQKDAQVALAYRHFMPAGLKIENVTFLGPTMLTDKGMSVYTQTRYRTFYGGRETRNGFWYTYADAKAVGGRGCVGECLETWKPVVAPKNAQGSGFWEVVARPDGVRQWAYKGAALYTFAGDKQPGEDNGNNRHEIIFGDPEGKIDLSLTGGDRRSASGSGFYWRLVPFFN